MAWTLWLVCFCFYIPNSYSTHAGLVVLFVFPFAAFYSPSEGPALFAYFVEVFPLSSRGSYDLCCCNELVLGCRPLSLTFPRLLAAFTSLVPSASTRELL